ncbi:MAG: response regulator [Xanthomonadales bacterium]|nr:response regulator [Xanthomonadales bacterium]
MSAPLPEPLSELLFGPMILIVEDEPKIAALLDEYLRGPGGYVTAVLHRGDQVMPWLDQHHADLVLLDLMLPGKDGLELCRLIRQNSAVPIIMLTARVEEIDRLLGLELGADDYICKPFSPREVVARVRAVLRRARQPADPDQQTADKTNASPDLRMDPSRYQAWLGDAELRLTPVEFNLLRLLTAQPGRVFSRDQLMNEMYSDYRVVSDRAVDTHIKNLRRKLQIAAPQLDLIESIYGVGYRARAEMLGQPVGLGRS